MSSSSGILFVLWLISSFGGSVSDHQSKNQPTHTVLVSWYGGQFHGRTMANGDVFDKHDPTTAAHKSLPFGTKVDVSNPETGQVITVEVRDRGPFSPGRTFDLSEAGAEMLGFKEEGVASLEVIILQ